MTIFKLIKKIEKLEKDIVRLKHEVSLLQQQTTINGKVRIITDTVEGHYGLPNKSVYKDTRKREIVEARQLSMYLIHKTAGLGLYKTGFLFNRRHCTVLHAEKTVKDLIDSNPVFRKNFIEICSRLKFDDELINNLTN